MSKLIAHQRQYVLGPAPFRLRPDWVTTRISEQLVLSRCPKLAVEKLQSQDGVDYWLLGLAVAADVAGATIPERFPAIHSTAIEEWTGFWAGRWLLISAGGVWQDASGNLGVNYRAVDGALWLSSSPALLGAHLPDAPVLPRLSWHIAHNKGMDWVPAPFTTRAGIFKLLPQRMIDPGNGTIRPVRFAPAKDHRDGNAAALARALVTVMTNWARCDFSTRLVGLTAGLDTRTVLAAARFASVDVDVVTDEFPFMDERDLALPPRLAGAIGVHHTLRKFAPVEAGEVDFREAVISEHLDGAIGHPSFWHQARYDHGGVSEPRSAMASGICFEVGRGFYWSKFAKVGDERAPCKADEILSAFIFRSSWRPQPLELWQQALQSWIDSLAQPVPLAMDWRDRFYLDQRLGSWNCHVQRGNDFVETAVFNPANSLWIFYLLLQFSPSERAAGVAQKEAIRILEPRLMKFPINPLSLRDRIKRYGRRLAGSSIGRTVRSFRKQVVAAR